MSNFTNFQMFPATNTCLLNKSDCGEKNEDLSQAAITFRLVKELHILSISNIENPYQSIQLVRTATSIAITISTSYSDSSLPVGSSNGGSDFQKPRQRKQHARHRQYFVPRLSTELSSDDGYSSCNNERRKSNNYRRRGNQSMSKAHHTPRPRSISTSSAESGVFSGDDCNYQPLPPRISCCIVDPVNSNRNNRGIHQNFSKNRRFTRNLQEMPTSATHFASSKIFNAPAASTLSQPPQHWLLGRAESLVNETESADEQEMAKKADTFDFYNLNMLLSVKA